MPDPREQRVGFVFWTDAGPRYPAVLNDLPHRGVKIEIPFILGPLQETLPELRGGVPEPLYFIDAIGVCKLLRIGYGGTRRRILATLPAVITLWADRAVYGNQNTDLPPSDYHGLRTQIGGLMAWGALRSSESELELGENQRVSGMRVHYKSVDAERITKTPPALSLHATWSGHEGPTGAGAEESAYVETTTVEATPLDEQLRMHSAIRDLLGLLSWRRCDFTRMQVNHKQLPSKTLSGHAYSEEWQPLSETFAPRITRSEDAENPNPDAFSLSYQDIGPAGTRKWLDIWTTQARTWNPALGVLYNPHNVIEADLLQLGIAIESLGYHLLLSDGLSVRRAKGTQFKDRCVRSAKFAGRPFLSVYSPIEEWAERTTSAYSGIKHVNRRMPTSRECYALAGPAVQLLRLAAMRYVGGKEQQRKWMLDRQFAIPRDYKRFFGELTATDEAKRSPTDGTETI